MKARYIYILTALSAFWLASCGDKGPSLVSPDSSGGPAVSTALQLDGLELLPGCLLDAEASRRISVEWNAEAGETVATLHGEDISELRALYFSLEHDETLGCLSLEPGSWAQGQSLQLALTPAAGQTEAGIVLEHPDEAEGYSGSGVLCRLHFGASRSQRVSSGVPLGPGAQVDFGYAPTLGIFHWYYRNQGDYDQNGEVSISDLTPLAIHFGKQSSGGPFSFPSIESVVDGDANGLISIADITPIGANYGNRVTGYNIYAGSIDGYPAGPAAPSSLPSLASLNLDAASGAPAVTRLHFEAGAPLPLPASSGAWVRPVDGASEGIASAAVGFGNQSPVAVINTSDRAGLAPHAFSADALSSTDPDGDALSHVWLLGDQLSLFSAQNILYNPEDMGAEQEFELLLPGDYLLVLVVRDADGALGLATQDITVSQEAGWKMTDLDLDLEFENADAILDLDLGEVRNQAALAYAYSTTGGGARFRIAQKGSIFSKDMDVLDILYAQSGVTAADVTLMEIDGTAAAAASFTRAGGSEVVFGRQVAYGENEMYDPIVLENNSAAHSGIDSCVVNGQAMLAWREDTNGELRFALAIDESAQNFLGPVALGITGAPDSPISLGVVNNAPVFSYWAGPNSNRLRFHNSSMPGLVPVFTSGVTLGVLQDVLAQDSMLVLRDGRPSVIYVVNGAMYMYRAVDETASMWDNLGQITQAGLGVVEYTTALHGGKPAIAYYDFLTAELRYLVAEDMDGNSWGSSELVEKSLQLGCRPSMTSIDGLPAIAYIDQGRNVVRYGIYVD